MAIKYQTRRVSVEDEPSIEHFIADAGVTREQTLELIRLWGNDHSILTGEASKLAKAKR